MKIISLNLYKMSSKAFSQAFALSLLKRAALEQQTAARFAVAQTEFSKIACTALAIENLKFVSSSVMAGHTSGSFRMMATRSSFGGVIGYTIQVDPLLIQREMIAAAQREGCFPFTIKLATSSDHWMCSWNALIEAPPDEKGTGAGEEK